MTRRLVEDHPSPPLLEKRQSRLREDTSDVRTKHEYKFDDPFQTLSNHLSQDSKIIIRYLPSQF